MWFPKVEPLKFLGHTAWTGIGALATISAFFISFCKFENAHESDVINIDQTLTTPPAIISQSDSCNSHENFRVLCEDSNMNRASATVSILPCKSVHIQEIRISDAYGKQYEMDKSSRNFEVPPGNDNKRSNVMIFYKSLSDGKVRTKSFLVNRFGQCVG